MISAVCGAIPPMRLILLENTLIVRTGIKPDPTPINIANSRSSLGVVDYQVFGVKKWYVPDTGCYDWNGMTGTKEMGIPSFNILSAPGDMAHVGSPDDPGQFINILV